MKYVYILLLMVIFAASALANDDSISIKIELNKTKYNLGNKIEIKVHFQNNSDQIQNIVIGRQEDRRLFGFIEIQHGDQKLPIGALYEIKDAPLGFDNEDYYELKPKETKTVLLKATLEKYRKRKMMGSTIYTGYAIVCENLAYLFSELGAYTLQMNYRPWFPSKDESVHSAYHNKKNVWNKPVLSNDCKFIIN